MYQSIRTAAAALLVGLTCAASALAVEGRQKLVVLAFGEDEFAIVDFTKDGGKVVSFEKNVLPNCTLGSVSEKDGVLTFELKAANGSGTFSGKADDKGVLKGIFTFRGNPYPAEVLKTDADKVAEMQSGKATQELRAAIRANAGKQPKEIRDAIEGLLKKYEGKPYANSIYSQFFDFADRFELKDEEVRKALDKWFANAKIYGDAWYAQTRKTAMGDLRGKKSTAPALLELAQELEKTIDEEKDMEGKVQALNMIASAATLLDKKDLASSTTEKLKGYEVKLDENYKKTVPPFKPEKAADKAGARPVVMELFTGAQCPPCVAADVAFDALGDTYSHSNLILLQYHLHIPGPDPLTNPDAISRQKFYGEEVRGTPSTFFNGSSDAGGGGSMGMSEMKYKAYREQIDRQLEKKPVATVNLSATRKGDKIEIDASAKLVDKPKESAKPKLRIVLTEEIVKYVGGNKLRFHHHVVRDLPGGAEGTAVDASGEVKKQVTVDLATLRGEIESYLSDYSKANTRGFASSLPSLEMKELSVVAFVQDDESHEILGAAQIDVKDTP